MTKKLMMAAACFAAAALFADTETVNGITWTYTVSNGMAEIYKDGTYPAIKNPDSNMTSVTIPSTLGGYPVTRIGDSAFRYCYNLNSSLTIPNSVTSIGNWAFSSCYGTYFTRVTIPNSVTSIGDGAFSGCSKLASVTIPNSVREIGDKAFVECDNSLFDTTTIPGVKLVDGWAVDNTGSLSGVLDLTGVRGIGGAAFSGCSRLTSVTIPEGVTSIGDFAFSGCSGLTSVTIPDSVTRIGEGAFYGCIGLTSVTIPDSVTRIGVGAFSGCNGLTSVTIPQCVCLTQLSSVFPSCRSFTNVVVGAAVTRLADYMFRDCSSLKSVVFEGDAPDVGIAVYDGTPRSLVTYVGVGTIGWSGGISSDLPTIWNERGVALVGGSGGGPSGGGISPSVSTTIVQQVEAPYSITNAPADRAIASVTVDGDCAIDDFVLKDGMVYDSVLRIVNTAPNEVKVTLPSGYVYETIGTASPLVLPASSKSLLTITRTADRTFLVTRQTLNVIQ